MLDITPDKFKYIRTNASVIPNDNLNKDIVTVIRISDNKPVYQFMTPKTSTVLQFQLDDFGDEWITCPITGIGRVFYNCTKDKVYTVKDDDFIWTGPYKTCGNYMLMDGCVGSFPYETKLIDTSHFPDYKYLNMEKYFTRPCTKPFYNEECFYEFIKSDGEINIRVIDDEGLYFNTIKLE